MLSCNTPEFLQMGHMHLSWNMDHDVYICPTWILMFTFVPIFSWLICFNSFSPCRRGGGGLNSTPPPPPAAPRPPPPTSTMDLIWNCKGVISNFCTHYACQISSFQRFKWISKKFDLECHSWTESVGHPPKGGVARVQENLAQDVFRITFCKKLLIIDKKLLMTDTHW